MDSYVTKVKIATGELIVMIWLFLIPAALLLIGIADLDIGYYTFMRIVVFLAGCFITFVSYKENDRVNFWTAAFALVAILFNPIIPVYLHDKDTWAVLDFIGAALFAIKGFLVYRESK